MVFIRRLRNLTGALPEDPPLISLIFCIVGFCLLFNAGKSYGNDQSADWNRISGPIAIVDQAPVHLMFLQPPPDRAEIYPAGRFSVSLNTALSNTLLWQASSDGYYGYIDMEMIRSSIELRYGIFSRVEIGMSIPFIYGYGGFMDHSILEVEKLLGGQRYLREDEGDTGKSNRYTYTVSRNGVVFIEGKEYAFGLGDLALRVKAKILNEDDIFPCLSARFSIKIPTGDNDRAMGSGAADFAAGLLLQKTVGRFTTYLNTDVVFPGQSFEQADISLSPFYIAMMGFEYKLTGRLSGHVHLSHQTRPFRDTGLDLLERRIWNLLLGLSYVTEKGFFIQGGLVEDIIGSSDAGADITLFLNLGKNF